MTQITELLVRIDHGNPLATDELLPLLYEELRQLAATQLRNEPGVESMQATALVHEAYLRLVGNGADRKWSHRGHFYMAAAKAMRRILVDRARARFAEKRGGGQRPALLHGQDCLDAVQSDSKLIALNSALEALTRLRPELARLVELRYFSGQTMAEAAACLGVSIRTAERDWTYAKAWLKQAIHDERNSENV